MNSDASAQQSDIQQALCEQVALACAQRNPLQIVGGNSKASYCADSSGETLSISGHSGIIDYEPAELVITARAGTPLQYIEKTLHEQQQMLAFEPPHIGDTATLGGTIACGLSGPRRPYAGAARDFILGTKIINGNGQALCFGGQVMKNVAGYDLSRMMAGAMGTLGLITEASLKVLPKPVEDITLQFDFDTATSIKRCNAWARKPLPISGSCILNDKLYIRLSGSAGTVQAAQSKIGGEVSSSKTFWTSLREQLHPYFNTTGNLWRLSVAPATAPLPLQGEWLIEWGGGQRWLKTDADEHSVRTVANQAGGHATLFDKSNGRRLLQPLDTPLIALHKRIKQALDPENIFNRGALYPEL